MKRVWWICYNLLVIPILYLFFWIASFFNKKINSGFIKRRVQNQKLIDKMGTLDKSKKMIWFHSASLGEFEQAKPIIKKLREETGAGVMEVKKALEGSKGDMKKAKDDGLFRKVCDGLIKDACEVLEEIGL